MQSLIFQNHKRTVMRKYYFNIASILVLAIWITSCSNDETKTQNQVLARPTRPIIASEVGIGTQIWMTKNLNVSNYRNGDPIPQVMDINEWASLTTGAWCYYENDSNYGKVYGKLYNWYAVNDPRGLAPQGYHVPSDTEWETLITFLGGMTVAGGKLKATTRWTIANNSASNSSGFTGLPGGYRRFFGYFNSIGIEGQWWSSTEFDSDNAYFRMLGYDSPYVFRNADHKIGGLSVRCVKD